MSVFDRLGELVSSPASAENLVTRNDIGLETSPDADLGIDAALSLLATERRRLVIRYAIEDADGTFDLVDVVRYIATFQYGPKYTATERKRVYISLYQTHLPELVDTGALERVDDGEAHTFRVAEPAGALYDVLDVATARLGGED